MMKFFRKHKKAVSPVIAVMLLVAVAVAAVGAYFIWFRSFQTQTQKSVQETSEGALGGGLQVISMTDDGAKYYVVLKNTLNSGQIRITGVRINPPSGAGNYSTSSTGDAYAIGAGQSKTFVISPTGGTPAFSFQTGTTRTFTIEGNTSLYVVVTTYTDS
ncbi:MAG: hypothetical protein GYA60_04355 [Candidatus Methanofastidiosa archaeon]|nr:hypothetical protein [Candidatus Methanofastidiosa archaeon]